MSFILLTLGFTLLLSYQTELDRPGQEISKPKSRPLRLEFTKYAERKYHITTDVFIQSISIENLSDSLRQSLLKYTNNQAIRSASIKMSHDMRKTVVKVKPGVSGEIQSSGDPLTIESVQINNKPFRSILLPHKVPKNPNQSLMTFELSTKRRLIHLDKRKDIQKLLGVEKDLYDELIEMMNNLQGFPDHDLAPGEFWSYRIRKNIPLSQLSPVLLLNYGKLTMDIRVNHTLKRIDEDKYYLSHKYSGDLSITLKVRDMDLDFRLTLEGQGESVINYREGLSYSSRFESDFDFQGEIDLDGVLAKRYGQPEIRMKGKIIHQSVPTALYSFHYKNPYRSVIAFFKPH
ncbi:MAG: hypothetical protein IEMM0008_0353 [bacterium]|nr:MAG: hypothetical protein IEMM0008_0353 [bacterium]